MHIIEETKLGYDVECNCGKHLFAFRTAVREVEPGQAGGAGSRPARFLRTLAGG
jgi:hypothetical protein